MPLSNGDDFQNASELAQEPILEVELEAAPRAQRPNFLTATRFVDFDLPPEILEGLDSAGFEYATPIQAQAIPVALKGLDIAGQAQTGTGKTTAFLVPLLCQLMKNKPLAPNLPRAIIITPTRELALQIYEEAQVLAKTTSLRQVLVIGGMDYKEQAETLGTNPEIIICTPGRIIDYLQQGIFKPGAVEVAVVDEADRLLDMGFIKDLKSLLAQLPSYTKRQTMLFSATLDDRVLDLTYEFMNPPQFITAEPDKNTKVHIEQQLYHMSRDEKLPLLLGLLRREDHNRVVIFRNTKSGVEWLAKKLVMNGFQAEGITGDLPQPKRLKLMESFKENRLQILVATDVASRGIHVDDVSHVYNYDLPQDAENYVHRIGRTARAGKSGQAVSFSCEDYVFHLEAIENLIGEKIPVFWAGENMFHSDLGGEVALKERRKTGGERKSIDRPLGRTEGRFNPRGPAKSLRPGGIFGLSPRFLAENAAGDPPRVLAWVVDGSPAEKVLAATSGSSMANSPLLAGVDAVSPDGKDLKSGKRRKRRRGRPLGPAPEGGAMAAPTTPLGAGDGLAITPNNIPGGKNEEIAPNQPPQGEVSPAPKAVAPTLGSSSPPLVVSPLALETKKPKAAPTRKPKISTLKKASQEQVGETSPKTPRAPKSAPPKPAPALSEPKSAQSDDLSKSPVAAVAPPRAGSRAKNLNKPPKEGPAPAAFKKSPPKSELVDSLKTPAAPKAKAKVAPKAKPQATPSIQSAPKAPRQKAAGADAQGAGDGSSQNLSATARPKKPLANKKQEGPNQKVNKAKETSSEKKPAKGKKADDTSTPLKAQASKPPKPKAAPKVLAKNPAAPRGKNEAALEKTPKPVKKATVNETS
ncbi:MAG: DEAD/DEAH box helicase [Candidatus Adiutrix sp.]